MKITELSKWKKIKPDEKKRLKDILHVASYDNLNGDNSVSADELKRKE